MVTVVALRVLTDMLAAIAMVNAALTVQNVLYVTVSVPHHLEIVHHAMAIAHKVNVHPDNLTIAHHAITTSHVLHAVTMTTSNLAPMPT